MGAAPLMRIDELREAPVVGRHYLVPTVRCSWLQSTKPWPVHLPLHSDADHLDYPWLHYHVDGRFLAPRDFAKRGDALDSQPLVHAWPPSTGEKLPAALLDDVPDEPDQAEARGAG